MIMLNNTAFSTFDLNLYFRNKKSMYLIKYVSETEHNLQELYDPDTKNYSTNN